MGYATVPELLARAGRRFAGAPALVTAEGSQSFAELLEGVVGVAAGLRSRGVRPGDRVLVAAGNSARRSQSAARRPSACSLEPGPEPLET